MFVSSTETNASVDYIVGSIVSHAKEALGPFQDPAIIPPDPSFVLQLPGEILAGSTLYAVQKTFDGPFQFDVFYESTSSKQKLSCMYVVNYMPLLLTYLCHSCATGSQH